MDALHRRTVLQLTGVVAVGGLVAACSSSSDATATAAATAGGDAGGSAGATGGGGGAGALAVTSDVPVGGGVVLQDQKVVVTQPTQGEFKAFSAVCTHQGCIVDKVADGTIDCPCHGSKFSIADGSVANGPATQPLPSVGIVVDGGNVVLS